MHDWNVTIPKLTGRQVLRNLLDVHLHAKGQDEEDMHEVQKGQDKIEKGDRIFMVDVEAYEEAKRRDQ